MMQEGEGVILRIFVGETDQHGARPLYEQIILKARQLGLAGATAFRGIIGYGAASRIHTTKLLRLSEDMPIVVEIIDTEEKISKLLPFLDEVIDDGLVTMENVRVLKYGTRRS